MKSKYTRTHKPNSTIHTHIPPANTTDTHFIIYLQQYQNGFFLNSTWMWKTLDERDLFKINFPFGKNEQQRQCCLALLFHIHSLSSLPSLAIISEHTQYINTRCGSGNNNSSSSISSSTTTTTTTNTINRCKESSILRIAHVIPLCYTDANNKCSNSLNSTNAV